METDLAVTWRPESAEEVINHWPQGQRLYLLAQAEQHFRKLADLQVLRALRDYKAKYRLS